MKLLKAGMMTVLAAMVFMAPAAKAGETLDAVKARGSLQVGVNGALFGFGMPDDKGVWRGLDVDSARAVAAGIFGDPEKAKFVTLTTQTRFTALQSKEIDVLFRNATRTLTRETDLGLNFVAVNYYDGQGFLVPKKLGVKSAKELNGATVCVLPGTTTEQNVADFFRANKLTMKPVVIEQNTELNQAFFPVGATF
jgi:general L-amino acid transport system substrate-binding protein